MKLTHRIHVLLFFYSLFWYNDFTEVWQDSSHFDLVMNPTHYESISVTWANLCLLAKDWFILREKVQSRFGNLFLNKKLIHVK